MPPVRVSHLSLFFLPSLKVGSSLDLTALGPTYMKFLPHEVAEDVWTALQDENLHDVCLTASDGCQVPACRFLLAARSKVLKRMLYGNFREATSTTICMVGYSSDVLSTVVEYCVRNDISRFTEKLGKDEQAVRHLVNLSKAADYLELPGLENICSIEIRSRMAGSPPLACVVYDEEGVGSDLSNEALQMIECRPYVSLDAGDNGGGIECLGADRINRIMCNDNIGAGELFLFDMLNRWYEHAKSIDEDAALQAACQCAQNIQYKNIEPKDLLEKIQSCSFVAPEAVFDAVAKQALRASADKVWVLPCRGKESTERVLVEGAGVREANGIYYLIAPLANGNLYSKKEVNCGQQRVYTLSCNLRNDSIECRIFSSTLLTPNAACSLRSMQKSNQIDPVFQPVLQFTSEPDRDPELNPTPVRKYFHVLVSDGEVEMTATLASALNEMVDSGDLRRTSICKVHSFGVYDRGGNACIHIKELSLITSNPGQQFGDPVPIEQVDCSTGLISANGLLNLYSCKQHHESRDICVPTTGWKVDSEGRSPSPKCIWIPREKGPLSPRRRSSTAGADSPSVANPRRKEQLSDQSL